MLTRFSNLNQQSNQSGYHIKVICTHDHMIYLISHKCKEHLKNSRYLLAYYKVDNYV